MALVIVTRSIAVHIELNQLDPYKSPSVRCPDPALSVYSRAHTNGYKAGWCGVRAAEGFHVHHVLAYYNM